MSPTAPRKPKNRPPADRETVLDEGERLFYEGDYEAAQSRFSQAIAIDDDDAEAHYLRARALFYLGRDEEAESAYDRALDLAPDFAPALIHKAELFVRAYGWSDDALDLLDEAEMLPLHRDDKIEASFARGLALMERGDYRAALEPMNRAVRGDGEWSEALRERGICRFYMWRFADAQRDLEQAIKRDVGDAEVHYFLAMIYERLGLERDAGRAYEQASSLDLQAFHPPHRVPCDEFRRAAAEAVDELPEEFRMRFDDISFAIEDLPAKEMGVLPDVFGLFVRDAEFRDSPLHQLSMPCRVVLFQRNLERIASDRTSLKDEIGKTVLHEVSHHFGIQDEDLTRIQIH